MGTNNGQLRTISAKGTLRQKPSNRDADRHKAGSSTRPDFTRQDAEALLVANIATFDHVIELLNRYASDIGDRALMGDEAKQQLDHLRSELKKLTLQMPTDPSTSATTGSLGDATNNLDEDDAGPGTQ